MRNLSALVAVLVLMSDLGAAAGKTVLFIGNSFTYGHGSAVRFYRADTVTDLNNEGIGGVPALFESFTQQAGLEYDVSLETRAGSGLDFHLQNKADVIGGRAPIRPTERTAPGPVSRSMRWDGTCVRRTTRPPPQRPSGR